MPWEPFSHSIANASLAQSHYFMTNLCRETKPIRIPGTLAFSLKTLGLLRVGTDNLHPSSPPSTVRSHVSHTLIPQTPSCKHIDPVLQILVFLEWLPQYPQIPQYWHSVGANQIRCQLRCHHHHWSANGLAPLFFCLFQLSSLPPGSTVPPLPLTW